MERGGGGGRKGQWNGRRIFNHYPLNDQIIISGKKPVDEKKDEEEEQPKYVLKDQQRKDEYPFLISQDSS